MCIDTVSLPNVSRYGDISIYCCISNPYIVLHTYIRSYVQTNKQYIQLTYQVVVKGVSGYCVCVNISFWQIQSHKYT